MNKTLVTYGKYEQEMVHTDARYAFYHIYLTKILIRWYY